MIVSTLTIDEQERLAYISGDTARAALLAQIMDLESEGTVHEKEMQTAVDAADREASEAIQAAERAQEEMYAAQDRAEEAESAANELREQIQALGEVPCA